MKPSSFLNCIAYNGVATGSTGQVVGIYDLNSGSGFLPVIYNLIHPSTGYNFSGHTIYSPAVPLISVGRSNIQSYQFTGVNAYRYGYTLSGDFSVLVDIEYSGCARSTTETAYTLLSTADTPTGNMSGVFYLGINDANRLFFETSGYVRTLPYELHANNMVYLSVGSQRNVEFGVFDLQEQKYYSEAFTLSNDLNLINKLYIGGFLNNSGRSHTGYFGRIYNSVLSNQPLDLSGLSSCSNCMFATGSTTGSPTVTTYAVPSITGYRISGTSGVIVTGTVPITGIVTKADNTTVNVVFPSGQTGFSQVEETITVLTGNISINVTGRAPVTYLKESRFNNYTTFDIEFDYALESGDTVEIYTYPDPNPYVNQPINNFNYPQSDRFVQVVGNGLIETKDTDYIVSRNLLSGFAEDDILYYDLPTGAALVSPFSGFWSRGKTLMSGGTYYPTTGQFNETIDTGRILITGITGTRFSKNYDVYLNGQKLLSGLAYRIVDASLSGWFGGAADLAVLVLDPSYVSDYVGNFLYHPTGGPPTGVASVEDSELTLLPQFGAFRRYSGETTGTISSFKNLTGLNEQVWVNGIRQRLDVDYVKLYPCTLVSGIIDEPYTPFNFYNNETGYFNIG
jgi:hypothetical protein